MSKTSKRVVVLEPPSDETQMLDHESGVVIDVDDEDARVEVVRREGGGIRLYVYTSTVSKVYPH